MPTSADGLLQEAKRYQAEQKRRGGPPLPDGVLAALQLIENFEAIDRHWQSVARRLKQTQQRSTRPEPRPLCGALTRASGSCQMKCVPGRTRCRLHGGLSTGPKSEAGRAAIAESNRRRARV